jgi:hypothetical protein
VFSTGFRSLESTSIIAFMGLCLTKIYGSEAEPTGVSVPITSSRIRKLIRGSHASTHFQPGGVILSDVQTE